MLQVGGNRANESQRRSKPGKVDQADRSEMDAFVRDEMEESARRKCWFPKIQKRMDGHYYLRFRDRKARAPTPSGNQKVTPR